ncbi:MAG: acylhydrolase [Gammaproteobacteria bacterium]|nr:MAG: acylhydrolase [Gammaproteobacteria bacterium]
MTIKTILCYGDSNLRGFVPGSFNEKTGLSARFPKNKRWTGVLQTILGEEYDVVEEGINGRTTTLEEITPGRPYRNGLATFPICIESHYPVDLVIFMLGTNDTKKQFNRSAEDIAEGVRQLVKIVKNSDKGVAKILLIAPQPIVKIGGLHPEFDDEAIAKSKALAPLYQKVAQEEGCDFLDAGLIISSSLLDGVHIEEADSRLLAEAVAKTVIRNFLRPVVN